MREFPRESAQIACVLVQSLQERGKAPGDISQLVGRRRLGERRDQSLTGQRGFAGAAQPGQAPGQTHGESEHRQNRDGARDEREIEQGGERLVAQRQPLIGGLRNLQMADDLTPVAIVNGGGHGDDPGIAGLVEKTAIQARQNAVVRRNLHHRRQRGGLREHPTVGRGHREPHAWLSELAQIRAELGRSRDQPAACGEILRQKGSVAVRLRSALVAIVDENAEAPADHR
jgi:hypothetical protein